MLTQQLKMERKSLAELVVAKGWEWARFSLMDLDRELARRAA